LRFITVARVRKDKGMDELLEAIRQLSADDPGMEFHLVGAYEEDSYREIIETAVNSMSLFYHGAVSRPEVHALIASSHCLIHPSYHEGMANSLLEAAAAGRPCLASDIPGCREAVEDGKTGYLFEARSAESLVNAIRKFASLPQAAREQMGISGRWKMEKEFDRRKVIAAYLDSIHDAIGMD
ncbi:MAG TPA: glycosyltransferase, partial [Clostridia bacterium]|nr:glycosyltransferase [Clostridia bacterium]